MTALFDFMLTHLRGAKDGFIHYAAFSQPAT